MSMLNRIQSGKNSMPPRIFIYGTEGIGKAQPLDAKVMTPHGPVNMGEISIGDEVIGSDGKACHVIGVYPQGEKEVYQVTFRDGSTTRCCDDHLWFTQTRGERDRGLSGAVRSLRDIRRTLRYGTHFNHGVPRVQPVEFTPLQQHLPIDPWLLGMYLGDGSSSGNIIITNPEQDIQQKIADSLEDGDTCVSDGGIGLRIKSERRTGRPSLTKTAIQTVGLAGLESHEKYVPGIYLVASVAQRISLLQGLIDSDGFVTNPGAIEFSTASPQLAKDVCFLIRSLGGSAKQVVKKDTTFTVHGEKRYGRPAYRIFASFTNGIVPVSSAKHTGKWASPQWAIRHTIRDVTLLGKMPCQCIRVDAPDSLYVTDDFILTHNSTFASEAPSPIFIQTEDGLDEIDCQKFPLASSYEEVVAALRDLHSEQHSYETVVIDSADWLERLVFDLLCQKFHTCSIEKVDGGYAKGYTHALTYWRELLNYLNRLRNERGMAVILIAHAKVEKFEDPESSPYDRYSPRLHKHAAALLTEWSDAVFFATRKIRTQSEDAGFNRKRTIAHTMGNDGSERILRCVGGPSCIAKNRYGIVSELPLSWSAFVAALAQNQPQGEPNNG